MSEQEPRDSAPVTRKEFNNFLETLNFRLDELLRLLEARIDTQERIVGETVKSYAELTSALETTIAQVMGRLSEEEREIYLRELRRRHLETLQMMESASDEIERRGENSTAGSIFRVASQHEGSTSFGQRSSTTDSGREGTTDGSES